MSASDYPQGLGPDSERPRKWHRHASPLSLILVGAFVAAGLSGKLGGTPHPHLKTTAGGVRLSIETPAIIRNGEIFETRIGVVANRPVDDLVLAVSPSLWRDITINSMIPAPADEKSEQGEYRFSYGPVAAGDRIDVKIAGQVNPALFAGTTGRIAVMDGDRTLAAQPLSMRVLP
jgi:hypothetical protein